MARNKFFQIGKREHPPPTNFGNDRTSIFPDEVPKRLLSQPEHPSGLLVVEQQRSYAI